MISKSADTEDGKEGIESFVKKESQLFGKVICKGENNSICSYGR